MLARTSQSSLIFVMLFSGALLLVTEPALLGGKPAGLCAPVTVQEFLAFEYLADNLFTWRGRGFDVPTFYPSSHAVFAGDYPLAFGVLGKVLRPFLPASVLFNLLSLVTIVSGAGAVYLLLLRLNVALSGSLTGALFFLATLALWIGDGAGLSEAYLAGAITALAWRRTTCASAFGVLAVLSSLLCGALATAALLVGAVCSPKKNLIPLLAASAFGLFFSYHHYLAYLDLTEILPRHEYAPLSLILAILVGWAAGKLGRGAWICSAVIAFGMFLLPHAAPQPIAPVSEAFRALDRRPDNGGVAILPFGDPLRKPADFFLRQLTAVSALGRSDTPLDGLRNTPNGAALRVPAETVRFAKTAQGFPRPKSIEALESIAGLRYVIYQSRGVKRFSRRKFERSLRRAHIEILLRDRSGSYLLQLPEVREGRRFTLSARPGEKITLSYSCRGCDTNQRLQVHMSSAGAAETTQQFDLSAKSRDLTLSLPRNSQRGVDGGNSSTIYIDLAGAGRHDRLILERIRVLDKWSVEPGSDF